MNKYKGAEVGSPTWTKEISRSRLSARRAVAGLALTATILASGLMSRKSSVASARPLAQTAAAGSNANPKLTSEITAMVPSLGQEVLRDYHTVPPSDRQIRSVQNPGPYKGTGTELNIEYPAHNKITGLRAEYLIDAVFGPGRRLRAQNLVDYSVGETQAMLKVPTWTPSLRFHPNLRPDTYEFGITETTLGEDFTNPQGDPSTRIWDASVSYYNGQRHAFTAQEDNSPSYGWTTGPSLLLNEPLSLPTFQAIYTQGEAQLQAAEHHRTIDYVQNICHGYPVATGKPAACSSPGS